MEHMWLLLLFVACAPVTSFETDIHPIVTSNCSVACHGGGFYEGQPPDFGGYGSDAAQAYDALVEVPSEDVPSMNLIEPGDPDASYLWHKLNGTQADVGGEGEGMPSAYSFSEGSGTVWNYPLDRVALELIELWIEEGAPR